MRIWIQLDSFIFGPPDSVQLQRIFKIIFIFNKILTRNNKFNRLNLCLPTYKYKYIFFKTEPTKVANL